ncbi:Sugar transporter STL1 [Colletotrichum viniferum]|nr:Sugar transporter STL1 [Colletotrichum viniferum]
MDQRHKWMVTARFKKRALLIAVNFLAGISIFFFGYDQGMMGGVNNAKHYIDLMRFGYVDDDGVPVVTDTLLQGGIMSVFYLGTLVGCMVGGSIGDRFGRIKTIAIGALWGIFGASLQCSSMNANWMIGSRLVNGIGTGILNGIVPVWASELSDYTSRGSFIAMEFTLNIFGAVVAYWLGYGVSFIDNGESAFRWRFPIAFQIIPLLFLLFGCFLFPESLRWLCKVHRHDEALYILQRLRGTGNDIAEADLSDIQDVLRLEDSSEGTGYHHMLFGLKSGWSFSRGPQCQSQRELGCCEQLGSSSGFDGLPLHKYLQSDMADGALAVPKTLTLVLPYIVGAINENAMYIFAAVNVISIPIVWALCPESNQRTLEEMDFLFAADTPWTWDAENVV